MTPPLTFRPADAQDWPAIWPIFHDIVAAGDTYVYDPATDSDAGRALWLAPPAETWLVIENEHTVVGTYKVGANRPGPGSHIGTASYMVAERARGKGVGRSMVLHSLERARALGFLGVQFNAVAATNVGAVQLYQDLGFQTIGAVPGGFRHPQQGLVDLLIMYRQL